MPRGSSEVSTVWLCELAPRHFRSRLATMRQGGSRNTSPSPGTYLRFRAQFELNERFALYSTVHSERRGPPSSFEVRSIRAGRLSNQPFTEAVPKRCVGDEAAGRETSHDEYPAPKAYGANATVAVTGNDPSDLYCSVNGITPGLTGAIVGYSNCVDPCQ
jgi:hypothetical protein